MYLEGFRTEGITRDVEPDGTPIDPKSPSGGQPRNVDMSRLSSRSVSVGKVSWTEKDV